MKRQISLALAFTCAAAICLLVTRRPSYRPPSGPTAHRSTESRLHQAVGIENLIENLPDVLNPSTDLTRKRYTTTLGTDTQSTTDDQTTEISIRANSTSETKLVIGDGLSLLRTKILAERPLSFLPEYKNPCYLEETGKFACLPYFFLLGMPKAGTTDLWSKITGHPNIPSVLKEPHWWARFSKKQPHLSSYAKIYTEGIQSAAAEHGPNKVIVGDGSASTFWDNSGWQPSYPEYANGEPPYIIADVIRAVLPDSKLIVIFTDPTDRLYSDYLYFNSQSSISPEDFHDRVVSTVQIFTNCLRSERSQRACAYGHNWDLSVRLHIGLYVVYARDWLQRFPRDQIRFVELGEWHQSCERVLPDIYRFLEVGELPVTNISAICNQRKRNVDVSKREHTGPMMNETRTILREFYRPFVLELASVIGDDKFLWDYGIE